MIDILTHRLIYIFATKLSLLTLTTKQISEAELKPLTSYLERLSQEMDLAFEDMYGQF